jgi:hypothetical protein
VHINQAAAGPVHLEPLPAHRLVRSCMAVHGYPKCIGAAAMGEERCTCSDTLSESDHQQCLAEAWEAHRQRRGRACHDCAFRKGSPEQDSVAAIAASPVPFRCHQGMPLDARRGTPVENAYAPVMRKSHRGVEAPDYPICAGWKRAHAALQRAKKNDTNQRSRQEDPLKKSRQPRPPPGEGTKKDTTLHLRMDEEFRGELAIIISWMEADPELRRLKVQLGQEKAVRYAIGQALKHPPPHVVST